LRDEREDRQFSRSASDDDLVIGQQAMTSKHQRTERDYHYNNVLLAGYGPTPRNRDGSPGNLYGLQAPHISIGVPPTQRNQLNLDIGHHNSCIALQAGSFNTPYQRVPLFDVNQSYGVRSNTAPYHSNSPWLNSEASFLSTMPVLNSSTVIPSAMPVVSNWGSVPPYWSVVPPQFNAPSQPGQNLNFPQPVEMQQARFAENEHTSQCSLFPYAFGSSNQQGAQMQQNSPAIDPGISKGQWEPTETRVFVNEQYPRLALLTSLAQQSITPHDSTQMNNITTMAGNNQRASTLVNWTNSFSQAQSLYHGGTPRIFPSLRDQFSRLTQPMSVAVDLRSGPVTTGFATGNNTTFVDRTTGSGGPLTNRIGVTWHANEANNAHNSAAWAAGKVNRSNSAGSLTEKHSEYSARKGLTNFAQMFSTTPSTVATKDAATNTNADAVNTGSTSIPGREPYQASHYRGSHPSPGTSDRIDGLGYQPLNYSDNQSTAAATQGFFYHSQGNPLRTCVYQPVHAMRNTNESTDRLVTVNNSSIQDNVKTSLAVGQPNRGETGGTIGGQFKGRISQQLNQQITLLLVELEAAKDLNITVSADIYMIVSNLR